MVRAQYSPERLRAEAFFYLTSFRYTARRLPFVTGQVIEDLQAGKLRLRTVSETHPDEQVRRERQVNRMVLGIVSAGFILGSSLALDADVPKLLGIPYPAAFGYFCAGVTLTWLMMAIFRSRKLW